MLSQPRNQHVIRKIRAALNAGIRPTAMVYGESTSGEWTPKDRALLEAYQILDDERCPECGNPVWICRNSDENIQFRVKSVICYGKSAMDEHRTDLKGMKNSKERADARRKFGKIEYPEPYTMDGAPLPTRSEFFEALADKVRIE